MRKLTTVACLLAVFALVLGSAIAADQATAPKTEKAGVKASYVGADKCKICHQEQHKTWSVTPHAKAFSKLSAEEQKKNECVPCHSTGTMTDGTFIPNVECEACHGPGSEYKSPKIMNKKTWTADPVKSLQLAKEAGLVIPDEKTCTRCHRKEGNPNFKPFDFAKNKPLVHFMSGAAEKKPVGGK